MEQQRIKAPLPLFYSYAHEDEPLREQLEKHLRLLSRQGIISDWHDRQIVAGMNWEQEIDEHLNTASIILLLISSDFLNSDYCYDREMQRALERHKHGEAHVIPVILRPCDWHNAPFGHLQCVPRDGKAVTEWEDQDAAFRDIAQSIRHAIERQAPPVLSSVARQNRLRLLKRVRQTWIAGVLEQSLHHAALITLNLQEQPDALDNPWHLEVQETNRPPHALPPGTSIVQVYDEADSELLILGQPGSGKTTLLLELARTLLERAEQEERAHLPVVFNLSSWAQTPQPLTEWLVKELHLKYQVPRKIGQSWLNSDQLLPLLDGLDEVAEEARSKCVQAINTYHEQRLREYGAAPLVICCRSQEYMAQPTRVALQQAVSIQPLTDEQILRYLQSAHGQLEELQRALRHDPKLYEMAQRPLLLSIFTLAYKNSKAVDIPSEVPSEALQNRVFATYVERVLSRRGLSKRFSPKQTHKWLTFLAVKMRQHNQTVFYLEHLQPDWLRGWQRWLLYRPSMVVDVGLIYGLIYGLFVGLIYRWLQKPDSTVIFSYDFALGAGLVGLLFIGPALSLSRIQTREEIFTRLWKGAKKSIFLGVIAGLLDWLILGLSWSLLSLPYGTSWTLWLLTMGPLFGLMGGLATGLIAGLSSNQVKNRTPPTPHEREIQPAGCRRLFDGLGSGSLVGLILGSFFTLLVWVLSRRVVFGLFLGPLLGLVYGLIAGALFYFSKVGSRAMPTSSRKAVQQSILLGVGAGLLSWFVFGLMLRLIGWPFGTTWIITGLFFGVMGGVVTGLIAGAIHRASAQNQQETSAAIYRLIDGLSGGWLVGLIFGPFSALIWGIFFGEIGYALLVGLLVGLIYGLAASLVFCFGRIQPGKVFTLSWQDVKPSVTFGLRASLISGLVIGLVLGIAEIYVGVRALAVGLAAGLFTGLVTGLAAGIIDGISRWQLQEHMRLIPNQGIWHSTRNGFISALIAGLIVGLIFMTAGWKDIKDALSFGLVSGVGFGLLVGPFFGLGTFLQHFILRLWLRCSGLLPWNLVSFLDEAVERLLLHKVGGGYIFVHRLLLDYFAALESKAPQGRRPS